MKSSVTVYLLQTVFKFLCIFILCGKAFKCQHQVVIGEIIFFTPPVHNNSYFRTLRMRNGMEL